MEMTPLRILICSGNEARIQYIANKLMDDGVQVQTISRLVDRLSFADHQWDFLLIDLDGLNSFLRSLLPAIFRKFPNLPRIGITTKPATDEDVLDRGYGLDLDAYLTEVPQPEDLIVSFPQVATKYLNTREPFPAKDTAAPNTQSYELSRHNGISVNYGESPLVI